MHRFIPALAAGLALAGSAHALDLTVEVGNAGSSQGHIGGALYASADTWLADGKARAAARVPAGAKAVLVFRNLPAGRIALSVFHDENGNGKLDVNAAGMPTERFGFSRDARGRMGPPSFDSAAIDLQSDTTVSVTLR